VWGGEERKGEKLEDIVGGRNRWENLGETRGGLLKPSLERETERVNGKEGMNHGGAAALLRKAQGGDEREGTN